MLVIQPQRPANVADWKNLGIAAMEGYEGSNARALQQWEAVYPDGALRVALTDTFSTRRE